MESQDPRHIWNRIARWWDEQIGEGNEFQRALIMPATDRLLEIQRGERVLDACCGNGNYARRLTLAGAVVTAFDGSEDFVAAARRRTTGEAIEYHVIDALNEGAIRGLGEGRFDAAVCSMALMDLPTISPLLGAVRRLLRPGGRFVFSISHPCFNSNGSVMTAELHNGRGKLRQVFGVSITSYLRASQDLASGILHQPEPHFTYHRSMSMLLKECVDAGFVVDGMEEPAFAAGSGGNTFSWKKRPEIPPALVWRLR